MSSSLYLLSPITMWLRNEILRIQRNEPEYLNVVPLHQSHVRTPSQVQGNSNGQTSCFPVPRAFTQFNRCSCCGSICIPRSNSLPSPFPFRFLNPSFPIILFDPFYGEMCSNEHIIDVYRVFDSTSNCLRGKNVSQIIVGQF